MSAPESGKKRRHNVGKACENCRRRRVKCDGLQPECGTCRVYKDECCWDAREDLRKPISRQQVEALQTRIADLEKMLKDHGLDPGHPAGSTGTVTEVEGVDPATTTSGAVVVNAADINAVKSQSDNDQRHNSDRSDEDSAEWPENSSQNHLVENDTGDFQVYGPTSAFRHLSLSNNSGNVTSPTAEPESHGPGFRKYLPTEVRLTEEEHSVAIDRFFRYYASWGQRTHPVLFLEDMHIALYSPSPAPKTPHYSPMLHNAILAIALCYSDTHYLQLTETRRLFAAEAKKYVEQEGTSPTVATVQGLAHLASYHSTAAEHNLGWLYIGMALRCALALGLNIDNAPMVKSGKLTEIQARERNVTYWTTFVQEGVWAPYIGRPVNWPEYTTPLPTVDEHLDSMIWNTEYVPDRIIDQSIKPQPAYISSAFVETVKLMEIGARIMKTLYGLRADLATLASTGIISEISLSLTTWYEQLPPQLVITSHSTKNLLPHILMMHLSWAWLSILLHRPFYRTVAKMPGNAGKQPLQEGYNAYLAIKHCDRAALHIVNLLQTWHRLHDLRFTPPTALQCCFVAGTTHLLAFVSNKTPKRKADALNRAKDCIRLMSYMAKSWPAGQQKQTLLENLLAEYGALADKTAQPDVKQEPPIECLQHSTQFDPLGPFAQQPVDNHFRPGEAHMQKTEYPPTQHAPTATSLYNIFENASYGSQPDFLNSHMESSSSAPSFPGMQYGHIPETQPSMRGGHSAQPVQQDQQFVQTVPSQYSTMVPGQPFQIQQSGEQNQNRQYWPGLDPGNHATPCTNEIFDVSPDIMQPAGVLFDPNMQNNQPRLDLNFADPSSQALLQFFMQSDYEFSRW